MDGYWNKLFFAPFLCVIAVLSFGNDAYAQPYSIKGRVIEKGGSLPSASIVLLRPSDSTVINSTLSNLNGSFLLRRVTKGNYVLKITYVGFQPYLRRIKVSKGDTLNAGTIMLSPMARELEEVTISGQQTSVIVKDDTIEFNAGSFKTNINASVQELLKKLPGVLVDRNGNVSIQGEPVTRILVDGKEFFGGNLQMATKNLPASAIEKVQVIDGQSEEERFTGLKSANQEKVINLTLNEESKKMGFGKAMGGAGTDARYIGQANYHRFRADRQVSILGQSNNISNAELSSDGSPLGGSSAGLPQSGVTVNHAAGTTIFQELAKNTNLTGSYHFNSTDAVLSDHLIRQNFLPEGTTLYSEDNYSKTTNFIHEATLGFEHRTLRKTIRFNASFNHLDVNARSASTRRSFSIYDTLVNEGERTAFTEFKSPALNSVFFYGQRFKKKGRALTLTNQFSLYNRNETGQSHAVTSYIGQFNDDLQQERFQESDIVNYSMRFTFTEPLGRRQYLQASYDLSHKQSESNLQVFDLNNEEPMLDDDQSNRFASGFLYHQVGLTYRLNLKRLAFSVGSQLQQSDLTGKTGGFLEETVSKRFQNILPNFSLDLKMKKSKKLKVDYITSIKEPSVAQLQPVVSRYDPLRVSLGNPDLRPEYSHIGKVNFRSTFLPSSGLFLTAMVKYDYTVNPIIPSVHIDEQQVQTIQYINGKASQTVSTHLNLGIPVEKFYSQINIGPEFTERKNVNFINGIPGDIVQETLGGYLGYNFNNDKTLDLNLEAYFSNTSSHYALDANRNQTFTSVSLNASTNIRLWKRFNLAADFIINQYKNNTTGENLSIPLLNFSVSRFIFRDDNGEIKFSGVNVLDYNTAVTQSASLNYMEQSTQNTIGRYYMLSFTYTFNKANEHK